MEELMLFQEGKNGFYEGIFFDFESGNVLKTPEVFESLNYQKFGFQRKMKVRSGVILDKEKRQGFCFQEIYNKLLEESKEIGLKRILIKFKKNGNRSDRRTEWEIKIKYFFII